MKVRKLYSIIVFALVAIPMKGQTIEQIQDVLKMGENQLVEETVKDAFVLVNTYYALQTDKGKRYGRDMHDYFGNCCYVGYSLSGGYITTADALTPWENDENYDVFRDDSKYTPVLLDSIMIRVCDGEGKLRGCVSNENVLFEELGVVRLQPNPSEQHILFGTQQENGKRGWLVFAMIPKEKKGLMDRKSVLSFTTKVMSVTENGMIVDEPQRNKETIVGGMFVVPQIKQTGLVEFQVKGFLVKNSDKKWKLVNYEDKWFPTIKDNEGQKTEETPHVEESQNEKQDSAEEPFAIPHKTPKKKPHLNRID